MLEVSSSELMKEKESKHKRNVIDFSVQKSTQKSSDNRVAFV